MARDKALQVNIDGSDPGNYPHKRIRNNDGSGNGTPVNEQVYGDQHEFFGKIMDDSKTPFNNLPDNVTNGYQYYDSLMSLAGKNDLIADIIQTSVSILSIPAKVSALKLNESIIYKTSFDSAPTMNLIQGIDGNSKQLSIVGTWKSGQFVRIINYANVVHITGLYDSQYVPNLAETITNITTQFTNWSKIMAVFVSNGAMVFWNKPANQIPTGWQEVQNWRGRIPVGLDETQGEFSTLGKEGGSKSVAIEKTNLPNIQLGIGLYDKGGAYQDDAPLDNVGPIVNGNQIKTEILGQKTPLNILNPYRTVLFIEFIG